MIGWIRKMRDRRPRPTVEDNTEMRELEARLDAAAAKLARERTPYDDRLKDRRSRKVVT